MSTANPATTAPATVPAEVFNSLGQSAVESRETVMPQADAFDMGLSQADLLATFFEGDSTKAAPAPATDKAATAGEGAPPVAPAPVTAGTGAAVVPPVAAPSSGTAPAPISSQPGTTPPASGAAVPGVTAPSAGVPASPAEAELTLRLQGMEAELARFRAAQSAPGTAPPVQAPVPQEQQLAAPAYNLDVPEALVNAILSEDAGTSRQGMATLVNSLATVIHRNMQQEMQQYTSGVMQRYQSQQQEAQQVNNLNADYYGAFPSHNTPAVAQMVAQEAQELQRITGASWSPQFRDALGTRVNARIAAITAMGLPVPGYTPPVGAPVAAPATPVVVTPVAPAPASFAPVSTREGGQATDDANGFMKRTIQG